jgi:hypothetical protein
MGGGKPKRSRSPSPELVCKACKKTSKEVRFYQRFFCSPDCHEQGTAIVDQAKKRAEKTGKIAVPCRNFQKGFCSRGKSCHFSHDRAVRPPRYGPAGRAARERAAGGDPARRSRSRSRERPTNRYGVPKRTPSPSPMPDDRRGAGPDAAAPAPAAPAPDQTPATLAYDTAIEAARGGDDAPAAADDAVDPPPPPPLPVSMGAIFRSARDDAA